jgi:uncharacterized protein (DUF1501 family)
MDESNLTRRGLLKKIGGTVAAAGLSVTLPKSEAWLGTDAKQKPVPSRPSAATPYRAAVAVYLFGGHDSNNLIVPLNRGGYQPYASIRRHLALPERSLHTISSRAGGQFGLHPSVPELHRLYESRRLAIVANVGSPSQRPTHFDRDLHYLPDAYAVPSWVARWVGIDRMSDEGRVVTGLPAAHRPGQANGLAIVSAKSDSSTNRRVDPLNDDEAGSTRLRTTFPASGLGQQLRSVAGLIASGRRAGAGRQVFFCALGGFDTHNRQLERHADLLKDLSASLGAFYDATEELGMADQVTAFTDTEFNRSLQPEGTGTGHGWGGHQIVIGGAVRGGDVYGEFPVMALGGPSDAGRDGAWRPTISDDQYAATIARWVGVPETALSTVFPQLSAEPLGFLG